MPISPYPFAGQNVTTFNRTFVNTTTYYTAICQTEGHATVQGPINIYKLYKIPLTGIDIFDHTSQGLIIR